MIYEVGKQVCAPCADSIQFDVADDTATLLIKIQKPTAKEKKSFTDDLRFRFVVVDDIIFTLIQLAGTWMDAPYYRGLSQNLTALPEIPDGQGLAIYAMLIDAATGILVKQKIFSPDTKMSRDLVAAILNQPEIPGYMIRLQSVYARYTTNDLVNLSRM